MNQNNTLKDLLKKEQDIINDLLTFFNNKHDFNKIIYTDWTAKDVLAHIVMWHENFANNIIDLINGNSNRSRLLGWIYEIRDGLTPKYADIHSFR
jgi:hypothetical protein